ncbi:MAG: hypothetical protein IJ935_12785 [Afipia sp.]|nr:hypothetical protein [Afipia sp.]
MFEPARIFWNAVDPETGVKLRIGASADIDSKSIIVEMPDGRIANCGFLIEPYQSDTDQSLVRLFVASLEQLARLRNGTRSENTKFVHYILTGLSVIHHKWPIVKNAHFYIDRDSYKDRDLTSLFTFDVPSDDEISILQT